MSACNQTFSGWRKVFWPIHFFEFKRLIPLALMMACIIFTYSVLRDVKDTFIVINCGAEALPFIKLYGTLPFALLFMMLYTFLSNHLSRRALFHSWIGFFGVFFLLFGFVLYPLRDTLHASSETLEAWQNSLPRIQYLILLMGQWTYSLFYIMAELWGTVALSVLFWQLANDITKIEEAKRFYPPLILMGNFGFVCAGPFMLLALHHFRAEGLQAQWDQTLQWVTVAVTLSIGALMILYEWIWRHDYFRHQESFSKTKKKKPPFVESILVVFRSRYLILMAILVVSYGVAMNLVEVTWKTQLKMQFSQSAEYVKAMGYFSTAFSFATVVLLLFGSSILRFCGWFLSALITPLIMTITGVLFFFVVIFGERLTLFFEFFGTENPCQVFRHVCCGNI